MRREDATLLLVTPEEEQPFVVLEAETASGMISDLDFIPRDLAPGMEPVLYPIEEYIADLVQLRYGVKPNAAETYRGWGVTHVALLALKRDSSDRSLMFGARSFKLGFILFYCGAHNRYRMIHCTNCATTLCGWIRDMQKEWGLYEGRGFQKARTSYN